ncbi:MAG: MOSC N-terminal beta barrel domain-containing protein [Cyanobacteria bacterium P01_A01_bin.83]
MIVSQLCVYPLKSAQGIALQQAQVTKKGLLWDRELMLISGSGKFITQRQFPQLAQVQVAIGSQNIITLSSSNNLISPLSFPSTVNSLSVEVEIWRDRILAIDQGDSVAQWFHQLLNLPSDKVCRLVRQSANQIRLLSKKHPGDEDHPLGFADNSPVMLTASASLTELNQRIMEIHQQQRQAIPMNRFRANIVISTTVPFVEDSWSLIQIGEVEFEVTKPCSRCIITTIDQQQGEKNQLKEPLNTLGTFRQLSEQGVMFGVNMIPQNEGTISIGDRLIVLKTRD